MATAKQELVNFLVKEAFDPVLEARPDGRSDAEKRKLKDVQDATRSEIDRFRGYGSADDVVTNFKRDLDSEPARKIHRELKSLGLPTLGDVRPQFEKKARELGVDA
ncbi:MAG: hypothetical protein ACK4YQ_06425 [Phenylobacterium sp.]|uniref:hypothetical protein n=1 Tax=Phenylobacterium sp. TaxID=1871053 RepID=UPI00391DEFF4